MLPTQEFGRTGHASTRVLFGAAAFMSVTQAEADRTMEYVIERGINHIDTAADYGESEERLGPWMRLHRDRFFLATKTGARTYEAAKESLERSLRRLQTDHVDLLQLHVLVDPDDWAQTFARDGAMRYLNEALEQGLTRFVGVTGHGLAVAKMHMRSLDEYPFDSVLLPWNYPLAQNPLYREEFGKLVERCASERVAVQTIKSICRRPWGEKEHTRATWYEPLESQKEIDTAVGWVLGHPNLFLNSVGDIDLLPRVVDAAERFVSAPERDAMEQMVRESGMEPLFVE